MTTHHCDRCRKEIKSLAAARGVHALVRVDDWDLDGGRGKDFLLCVSCFRAFVKFIWRRTATT